MILPKVGPLLQSQFGRRCASKKYSPTAAEAYADPASLWQGTQDLRSVLEDEDLTALAGHDKASGGSACGQRNSRTDRLLSHVGVEELTLDGLVKQLEDAAQRAQRLRSWLARHNHAWVQSLYLLLNGIKGYQVSRLGRLPMVRTADGEHVSANEVRFAPADDGVDRDVEVRGVSLIAAGLLAGKKQVRAEMTAFLQQNGE